MLRLHRAVEGAIFHNVQLNKCCCLVKQRSNIDAHMLAAGDSLDKGMDGVRREGRALGWLSSRTASYGVRREGRTLGWLFSRTATYGVRREGRTVWIRV
eukprot:353935-Chlamydomonas_euryale.AAC.4